MKRTIGLWLMLALLLCGCGQLVETAEGNPPEDRVEEVEQASAPFDWDGMTIEDLYLSPFGRNEEKWLTFPDALDGVPYDEYYPGLVADLWVYEEGATGDLITEAAYWSEEDKELFGAIRIFMRSDTRRIDRVEVTHYDGCFGPYGIRCGMGFDEVMECMDLPIFRDGTEYEELFPSGMTDLLRMDSKDSDVTLPPKVTVIRNPDTIDVNLLCPAHPYPEDMERSDYVYCEHYGIFLGFDGGNRLVTWSWYIGALAE